MTKKTLKNTANIVLQGKGGIGKSFVSSILTQYFEEKGYNYIAIDSDPVNKTLSKFNKGKPIEDTDNYIGIKVIPINIVKDDLVRPDKFDITFSTIITEDETVVLDVGSSSFLPTVKYINDNNIFGLVKEYKKTLYLHTIVCGGQDELDTLDGVKKIYEMCKDFESIQLIVWKNDKPPAFTDNFTFEKLLKPYKDKIASVVHIKNFENEAITNDLLNITQSGTTRQEYEKDPKTNLISKTRINMFFNYIYDQLDKIY